MMPTPTPTPPHPAKRRVCLTADMKAKIVAAYRSGTSSLELAHRYNVSRSSVSAWARAARPKPVATANPVAVRRLNGNTATAIDLIFDMYDDDIVTREVAVQMILKATEPA